MVARRRAGMWLLGATCALSVGLNFLLLARMQPAAAIERERELSAMLQRDLSACLAARPPTTTTAHQPPSPRVAVEAPPSQPPPAAERTGDKEGARDGLPRVFAFVPYVRDEQMGAVAESWAHALHPHVHFVSASNASAQTAAVTVHEHATLTVATAAGERRTVRSGGGRAWREVRVPGTEGGSATTLCGKTLRYLRWACGQGDVRGADWVFKADTDTLVLWRSLRAQLARYDPAGSHYLGYLWRMVPYQLQRAYAWHDGGAGYAISRGAFDRLCATAGVDAATGEQTLAGLTPAAADALRYEDVLVAHMLKTAGVAPSPDLSAHFSHFAPSEWRTRGVVPGGAAVSFHGIKDPACLREIGAAIDYVLS